MDDSPSLLKKRPNRLSLAKHGKVGDSPKTPCRAVASPTTVNTPPAIRFNGNMLGSHSTPVTHCKRSCFIEESPSQDYDSDPQTIICTQDVRQNIVDVDWKWEEQCPNIAKPVNNTKPRRAQSLKLNRPQRQIKKSFLVESPECHQKRGFFKFKEELLRDMKNKNNDSSSDCGTSTRDSSPLTDFEQDELGLSLKENDDMGVLNSIADLRKNNHRKMPHRSKTMLEMKPSTSSGRLKRSSTEEQNLDSAQRIKTITTRLPEAHEDRTRSRVKPDIQKTEKPTSTETNLLEDSDFDHLFIQCSQQVEATYHNQVKRKKVEKNDFFVDDSMDDIFLSIPIDDKLLLGASAATKQCRSPLIRHNSMPVKAPVLKPIPKCTVNSFTRHNSMPPRSDQKPTTSTISTSSSKSSSSESIASEKRRCAAEDIERKRLEALQRRETNKLKKTYTSNNNSNKVKR